MVSMRKPVSPKKIISGSQLPKKTILVLPCNTPRLHNFLQTNRKQNKSSIAAKGKLCFLFLLKKKKKPNPQTWRQVCP